MRSLPGWACLRPALELKRNLDLGFSAGLSAGFSPGQWKIYSEDFSVKNLKDFTGTIYKFCVILPVLFLGVILSQPNNLIILCGLLPVPMSTYKQQIPHFLITYLICLSKVGLPCLTKFGFVPQQAPCSDPQRPKYIYIYIKMYLYIFIYIYFLHFGGNYPLP